MPKKTRKLNPREAKFVREYLIDLNATRAALRAGFSEQTANKQAYKWVGKNRSQCPGHKLAVWDAVNKGKQDRAERTKIDADYVLKRLVEIDQMDVLDILADDGSLKPVREWPKSWRTLISGIDITEMATKEDAMVVLKKIKWPDKVKNLELIGRHVDVKAWDKDSNGGAEEIAQALSGLADKLPG